MTNRKALNGNNGNASAEALITLKTLAAAAKHVEDQSKHRRHQVTIVNCESASQSETEEFMSELAFA
jgi:hypothetical protein